ncbi:hypothetical protein B296_00037671 [Ensete ventricosum]|uniref:Uncharacterized protein n=1 Tax=Ensete ventricosum TaxID=4639 RepID=A0A426Y8I3_ENSVE|nr:hypothetical protein B296_00037671 [Ensete ventricosum]
MRQYSDHFPLTTTTTQRAGELFKGQPRLSKVVERTELYFGWQKRSGTLVIPSGLVYSLWVTNIRMRELLPPSNPIHKSAEGRMRKRKMTSKEQKKGVLHERLQLLRSVTNSSAVRSGVL